jgi:hypothetical protein
VEGRNRGSKGVKNKRRGEQNEESRMRDDADDDDWTMIG